MQFERLLLPGCGIIDFICYIIQGDEISTLIEVNYQNDPDGPYFVMRGDAIHKMDFTKMIEYTDTDQLHHYLRRRPVLNVRQNEDKQAV